MALNLTDLVDGTRLAAGGLKDFATGLVSPSLRLGVTGLSRSGKTVFITALVHALLKQARLPVFEAHARGRISRCYLEPQPDDDLPRFSYEKHLEALTGPDRHWPEGTRRISQLRLTIEYEPRGLLARNLHGGKLHLDIVDYPGEWLLDLPLLTKSRRNVPSPDTGLTVTSITVPLPAETEAMVPAADPLVVRAKSLVSTPLTLSLNVTR